MLAMDQIPKPLPEPSKTQQSSLTGELIPKIPQDDNNDNGDSAYGSIESPDEIHNSSNIVRAICFRNINNSVMSFI